MTRTSLLLMLLVSPALITQCAAQTVRYKCPNCGRYHVRAVSTPAIQPASAVTVKSPTQVIAQPASVATSPAASVSSSKLPSSNAVPSSSVLQASAVRVLPQTTSSAPSRWRFDKANNWTRRIDPNAQAWAQAEANRIAQRGYQGYLKNGHPGGNNPYGTVTGTGTTFPGADLIHTCEGSPGMTLVAEAAAVSWDGRIYGVRSWR